MIKIKRFIQVKGGADSGKTTTITHCFLSLLSLLQKAKLKSLKYLDKGDFVAVVEYKGNMIAFVSRGDIEKEAKNSYKTLCELCQSEVEVCVFATRTKGKSVEFWQEILEQNGKQEFDKVLENSEWFNICLNEAGDNQDNSIKIANYLEEQSKKLAEYVEQIIQEK